jgi:hypothetical protein
VEEHCYGSWIQRILNVPAFDMVPGGRKELVKKPALPSAKVFLPHVTLDLCLTVHSLMVCSVCLRFITSMVPTGVQSPFVVD